MTEVSIYKFIVHKKWTTLSSQKWTILSSQKVDDSKSKKWMTLSS